MNWQSTALDWRCKYLSVPLCGGNYVVRYSIPAASHFCSFESNLSLTRQQANNIKLAVAATRAGMRVFNTDYEHKEHRKIAAELSQILDQQSPQYRHLVGVIFSIEPAATTSKGLTP